MLKLVCNLIVSSVFIFSASISQAASCCAGGFVGVSLISGLDNQQLTLTTSRTSPIADVNSRGQWSTPVDSRVTYVFKTDYAWMLNENFQIGFSVPVESKFISSYRPSTHTALADISAFAAYRYNAELLTFFSLVAPTGKSIYDQANVLPSVHGKGFWTPSLGFYKKWSFNDYRFILLSEVHHSLPRNYSQEQNHFKISPQWGESAQMSLGYKEGDSDFLVSVKASHEDPIKMTGILNSKGAFQRWIDTSLSYSETFLEKHSFALGYGNSSWFGKPSNVQLNESFTVSYQLKN